MVTDPNFRDIQTPEVRKFSSILGLIKNQKSHSDSLDSFK